MKPVPLTAKRKAELKREAALDSFVAATSVTLDPASLSRSYGVEMPVVVRILKERGKYHG